MIKIICIIVTQGDWPSGLRRSNHIGRIPVQTPVGAKLEAKLGSTYLLVQI